MSAEKVERIELAVDIAAAVLFAVAAAWCGTRLFSGFLGAVAAAIVGLCASLALLRAVRPADQRFRLPDFGVPQVPSPVDELLLTQAERVPEEASPATPELLLDDVLAELASDSRVVRLFDAAAMPTPGELRARIDRHLDTGRVSAAPPDASQALHEALAELRRSIR
jgi:hypothetical protein